jgi:DNA-directed RNA polymerase subunit RPC12/RpoP
MTFIYRCSRCRTRNSFKRQLEQLGLERCRSCGHTSFYVDKERQRRKPCLCGGYHFKHRPGSKCCEMNVMHPYHRAAREGAPEEFLLDILVDLAWENEGGRIVSDVVPF